LAGLAVARAKQSEFCGMFTDAERATNCCPFAAQNPADLVLDLKAP
jgi:hypothetical protein